MASRYLTPKEQTTNRLFVLAIYRHLLRATGLAFRQDTPTLLASRARARQSFAQNRRLDVGGEEAASALEHARGVTKILRENVVQGVKKGEDTYKLRMHEHTQRNENLTATSLKGTKKSFKEIKNASF